MFELKQVAHRLLWRVLVLILAVLVSQESAAVVADYLAHLEGASHLHTSAPSWQVVDDDQTVPVLLLCVLGYAVNLQKQIDMQR